MNDLARISVRSGRYCRHVSMQSFPVAVILPHNISTAQHPPGLPTLYLAPDQDSTRPHTHHTYWAGCFSVCRPENRAQTRKCEIRSGSQSICLQLVTGAEGWAVKPYEVIFELCWRVFAPPLVFILISLISNAVSWLKKCWQRLS